jgi:hypothetical protein
MQNNPVSTNAMTTNNAISHPTIAKPNEATHIQNNFCLIRKKHVKTSKKIRQKKYFSAYPFFYVFYFFVQTPKKF